MITRITTLPQLEALQNSTMIYAVISALIALLIAFIISFIIKYQGGQDKSYITRRIWFIVIGIVSAAGFYLYNDLVVKGQIVNAGFKSMFVETNITCIGDSSWNLFCSRYSDNVYLQKFKIWFYFR